MAAVSGPISAVTAQAAARHIRGRTIAWGRGTYFDFDNPETTDMTIEEYAYALAYTVRWRGQTVRVARPWWRRLLQLHPAHCFYGVGQHVVIGAEQMLRAGFAPRVALAFLGHESDEVPFPDMPGPTKSLMSPEMRAVLKRCGDALDHRFGFDCWPDYDLIKRWDVRMLVTEKRDLLIGFSQDVWHNGGNGGQTSIVGFEPFAQRIVPYRHPDQAAKRFLELYHQLKKAA